MHEQRTDSGREGGVALHWRDDSGKSSIRGVLALAVIVAMVYIGVKVIPVRTAALQFSDAMREEVVYAGGRRRMTNDEIMSSLLERAVILGLPIERKDITIQRQGRKYIVIKAEYTTVIEFIGGYELEWSFSPSHEGPIF